ncbi:response regulator transcription factor [Saccharopolyspora sp. K220]|uniref:response regulator n=1 Tax=Saccharopolyspora soli TaxID=2926618 RepID=UPI001F5A29DD|nr:response regulator transcription factor [Saccharopolyspora soli]MCI2422008.1 response regulator transcription factor [Saccharopolyspora soli]
MIRVLVVDDEALVRAGLRMILEPAADIEVVAEASDGGEAITAVAKHRPDVVLMDVRMPGMDGLTALRELRRSPSAPKVIMLTTFDLDDYVHGALRGGAAGFLLKDTAPHDLTNAVRIIAEGSAMLTPSVTKRLIDTFAELESPSAVDARRRLSVLTGREETVVRAVARGLSNAEIGLELAMSEGTVKVHVSRALAKLNLANRVQLALLVRDAGPTPPR